MKEGRRRGEQAPVEQTLLPWHRILIIACEYTWKRTPLLQALFQGQPWSCEPRQPQSHFYLMDLNIATENICCLEEFTAEISN